MRKLIFFDIDGTIIDEEKKEMSESTRQAIEQARANGHICVVNTGRTWKMVNGIITPLAEFDGYVAGCGTMVIYRDKLLLHETFSEEMSRKIIEALRKHEIDAVLEGKENNYMDSPDRIHTKIFKKFVEQFRNDGYGSFEDAVGHFDKFFAYAGSLERIKPFLDEFSGALEAVDRERGYFEMMPAGFSKASGMRFLAEKLGVPMEDTVAIGDSNNDIPMLECAHTSIAMGKSSEAVLAMADYITTTVEQNGIKNALKWLKVL